MAWSSWSSVYKKSERSPLDRFKNRNRLLKTFGENGPKIYDSLTGEEQAGRLQEASGIEKGEFALVMDFIISNGMASLSSGGDEGEAGGDGGIAAVEEGALQGPDFEGAPSISDDVQGESEPSDYDSSPRKKARKKAGPKTEELDYESSLSPLEKIIWDKYGESGVKVYNLIDGEKTAEEILHETGISESKLVEILEFMNDEGIIKLEKPPERKKEKSRPPLGLPSRLEGGGKSDSDSDPESEDSQKEPSGDVGFKPMVEAVHVPEAASTAPQTAQPSKVMLASSSENKDEQNPDAVPVDVPIMAKRGFAKEIKFKLAMLKYGPLGNAIAKRVDGAKDFVEIAVETGQPFSNIDIVLGDLGKKGLATFKTLTRTEIAHRYGDDGLAVYKRFGRDGLLIYQMIGKVSSLRDLVAISHVGHEKSAEIILFVHKVLGLDMPLERDMVFRYLDR